MKCLLLVVITAFLFSECFAGGVGDSGGTQFDLKLIASQLEHFRKGKYELTEDEQKDLDEAIVQVKTCANRVETKRNDEVNTSRDIMLFRESPAYDFLNAEERRQLQELYAWVREVELGSKADVEPPTFFNGNERNRNDARFSRPPVGLQSGDLVFRREDTFLSHHFVEASKHEKRFSHVGIVLANAGPVTVLSVGDGANTIGDVGITKWQTFTAAASDCAVYRYKGPASIGERIAKAAEKRIGIPFDPAFDLKTKDRLYCSELVRDAVNEAVGKTVVGTTKKGTFEYVAIDDCYRSGWIKVYDAKDGK